MTLRTPQALLCATLLACCSSVLAQTPTPTPTPTAPAPADAASAPSGKHPMRAREARPMSRLDTDHDGQISRDEAKGHPMLEQRFDAIDADHDGKLSPQEMKQYHAAHAGEHREAMQKNAETQFKKMDSNQDGALSRDEVKGHPHLARDFDAIDANQDGRLSPDELKAFAEKMHAGHRAHMGQRGAPAAAPAAK